jgi:hypothetical protein
MHPLNGQWLHAPHPSLSQLHFQNEMFNMASISLPLFSIWPVEFVSTSDLVQLLDRYLQDLNTSLNFKAPAEHSTFWLSVTVSLSHFLSMS